MARHDRVSARQLRQVEEELERCEQRARHYEERIAELKKARERLTSRREGERDGAPAETARQGDPAAQGDQLGGVLGNLVNSLDADTIRALGEAAKGIDVNALLSSVGGAGGLSKLAGALGGGGELAGLGELLGGGAGQGAGGPGLAGLLGSLGGGGGSGGSVLDGVTEVIDFFTKRPTGSTWSVKDVPQALKLLGSPNVRSLVSTASRLNSLWKGIKGLQKAGALGSMMARPVPAEPAPPSAPSLLVSPVRFTQLGGSATVLEPWRGARAG